MIVPDTQSLANLFDYQKDIYKFVLRQINVREFCFLMK